MMDQVNKALDNGECVIGIFLDFSKAFDTVNHSILIDKLLECAVWQESRDEYYTPGSLNTVFATVPETYIVEFLWEAGLF